MVAALNRRIIIIRSNDEKQGCREEKRREGWLGSLRGISYSTIMHRGYSFEMILSTKVCVLCTWVLQLSRRK